MMPRSGGSVIRNSLIVIVFALGLLLAYYLYTRHYNSPINLIVITIEGARSDRMGFNGYSRQTTPKLDKLVKDGVSFTQAFSQAAWTSPGVISTLTGLYPPTHGVTAKGRTVPTSTYTLLDGFKERGYRIPDMSYLSVVQNFKNIAEMEETGIDQDAKNEIDLITGWISDNHEDPFAFWYHWRFSHLPYDPPDQKKFFPPASNLEAQRPERIETLIQTEVLIPYANELTWTTEEKEWIDALYDAQMRWFDDHLERIRDELAKHDILDNTIIIITADHGEELVDHGHVGHASTALMSRHFDEHLHIPLVILAPDLIAKGRNIDTMVQQVDILPTVFEMMGWEIPKAVQGRSLLPAINGQPMEDLPVYAESIEAGYQSKPHQQRTFIRSIRTRNWKLIGRYSPIGTDFSLYNVEIDPDEKVDVFDEEREVGDGLRGLLSQWIERNIKDRAALEKQETLLTERDETQDLANLSVPTILKPTDGDTVFFESTNGSIEVAWTGDPLAAYVIEYDVGEGLHQLNGFDPVDEGTSKVFGPLPEDVWKSLYQFNPYRIRIRPRDLPDGWSDWISVQIAPLQD